MSSEREGLPLFFLRVIYGHAGSFLLLAESSAYVCNSGSQHRGAPLEMRQKCWQLANRGSDSVSRKAPQKKKSARFCSRLLLAAFCFKNGLFGDPGAIRTRDVPLRRSGQRSPALSFQTPGNPSITTFLTVRGCSHILRKTPNIPR